MDASGKFSLSYIAVGETVNEDKTGQITRKNVWVEIF